MPQGRKPSAFSHLHLGDMLTLGIGEAGLWSFGLAIGGRLAALCRRGVYIFRANSPPSNKGGTQSLGRTDASRFYALESLVLSSLAVR